MRRGLLSWSEEEVPRSVLDGRVQRCRDAMAAAGLEALLVYTNFPRPAAVSYLTHFVPYWSQGVLVILPDRDPVFTVSLSKRVANWIEETAHVAEIVCTPNIGRELGALMTGIKKVGVVELGKLPGMIVGNLREAHDSVELIDATAMFAEFRQSADNVEIAITRRAAQIAHQALDLVQLGDVSQIERSARMQGCEEVLIDIAEDLSADQQFRRLDGPTVFKNRYAVRLSLAYKGHWVRVGRTFEKKDGGADRVALVESYLATALPQLCADPPDGFQAVDQVIESCIGSAPLTVLPNSAPGSIISFTQRWRDDEGYWLVSEPLLLAGAGEPAEILEGV